MGALAEFEAATNQVHTRVLINQATPRRRWAPSQTSQPHGTTSPACMRRLETWSLHNRRYEVR